MTESTTTQAQYCRIALCYPLSQKKLIQASLKKILLEFCLRHVLAEN